MYGNFTQCAILVEFQSLWEQKYLWRILCWWYRIMLCKTKLHAKFIFPNKSGFFFFNVFIFINMCLIDILHPHLYLPWCILYCVACNMMIRVTSNHVRHIRLCHVFLLKIAAASQINMISESFGTRRE